MRKTVAETAHDAISDIREPIVSVVIPARNEALHIGASIRTIAATFRKSEITFEIIVVDDESTDGTRVEAERAFRDLSLDATVIETKKSLGKGNAVACGFRAATGQVVGFIDADLEYPVEILPAMAEIIVQDGSRCVIACREHDERPWFERKTSRLAHWLASFTLQLPVKDTQAGLKVFPGWFARDVLGHAKEKGWLYDIEALIEARHHALTIVEVPVTQRSLRPRRADVGQMAACAPVLVQMAWKHWKTVTKKFMTRRWQLLRFGMVGAVNTLVDLVAFWLLVLVWPPFHNGFEAAFESLGAWLLASLSGYVLHSRFSFGTRLPVLGFYVVTTTGISIQMVMSGMASHVFGNAGAMAGKIIGIAGASVITYGGYHYLARHTSSTKGSVRTTHSSEQPAVESTRL